jgi:hypothetical protein
MSNSRDSLIPSVKKTGNKMVGRAGDIFQSRIDDNSIEIVLKQNQIRVFRDQLANDTSLSKSDIKKINDNINKLSAQIKKLVDENNNIIPRYISILETQKSLQDSISDAKSGGEMAKLQTDLNNALTIYNIGFVKTDEIGFTITSITNTVVKMDLSKTKPIFQSWLDYNLSVITSKQSDIRIFRSQLLAVSDEDSRLYSSLNKSIATLLDDIDTLLQSNIDIQSYIDTLGSTNAFLRALELANTTAKTDNLENLVDDAYKLYKTPFSIRQGFGVINRTRVLEALILIYMIWKAIPLPVTPTTTAAPDPNALDPNAPSIDYGAILGYLDTNQRKVVDAAYATMFSPTVLAFIYNNDKKFYTSRIWTRVLDIYGIGTGKSGSSIFAYEILYQDDDVDDFLKYLVTTEIVNPSAFFSNANNNFPDIEPVNQVDPLTVPDKYSMINTLYSVGYKIVNFPRRTINVIISDARILSLLDKVPLPPPPP